MQTNFQQIIKEIDSAFSRKNEGDIKSAIDKGENFLKRLNDEKKYVLLSYYLANAYSDLYFQIQNKNKKDIISSISLQRTKLLLRNVLQSKTNFIEPFLKKQIWVNYGNVLDHLGRSIEAIYAYDKALEIDPKFSMAVANKAITSCYFAKISGEYAGAIHIDAYQMLRSVINDQSLIKIGGATAKFYFEQQLKGIEQIIIDKRMLEHKIKHPKFNISALSHFERRYIRFCIDNDLFLNFHIHDKSCKEAINDSIFIKMVTKIDDNTTFYNFSRYLNQIKEDYATARLLLVQSQYKSGDINNISRITSFVYPLDYSQSTIYHGLLKSAFKEAFNILDKISLFLNSYYHLGFENYEVYFETIWSSREERNIRSRAILTNTENMSIYGLYDIYKDFQTEQYKDLKDIRNALTHRKLTIYEMGMSEIRKSDDNIELKDMFEQTINLMKLVKAMIIYLVNAVSIEESKKRKECGKIIPEITVDTTQFL